MKKFQFTLSALLRVKMLLEQEKLTQVNEVAQRLQILEEELAELFRRQENTGNNFRAKMKSGSTAESLKNFSRYLAQLRISIKTQHKKIDVAQNELEQKRSELVELMRERKMLEKLKEKQYNEYLVEVAKQQAKELDDFVSYTSFKTL